VTLYETAWEQLDAALSFGVICRSRRMARLARVVVRDLPHHVTQRGNRRERVFFDYGDTV
jgi:hypothetical protein